MIYLQDSDFTLHVGDVRDVLEQLPAGSVDCVVTSPPYWGLRDYGTGSWEGGDPDCDHLEPFRGGTNNSTLTHGPGGKPFTPDEMSRIMENRCSQFRDVCGKCGATRQDQQLGLEPTPDLYVTNMVNVFREIRRVLADHGTCWVNLGDSYAAGKNGRDDADIHHRTQRQTDALYPVQTGTQRKAPPGLKPKDLVGIPWRIAFALQADGWYLRSDIIWAKPNPMPESVTDRPTKSHEYVFLLSKRPRYWFDAEAVREPHASDALERTLNPADGFGSGEGNGAKRTMHAFGAHPAGRNVRSVWEIATQPYPEAHFATYPEELVRRCLLAGCPEGGTVLDPFLGSGTTAIVARRHGRRCIGIELNQTYAELAARRTKQLSLLAEAHA